MFSKFRQKTNLFYQQAIPISLTMVVFAALSTALFFLIQILNKFVPANQAVLVRFHWTDILAGMFVYFKTSVDFTLFIGRLMQSNQGWRKRIAIEIGTALGNAVSTMLVLCLWVIFKELRFLLGLMTFVAALVLFE